jgi:uroporphyrinogen-III decarboxylase
MKPMTSRERVRAVAHREPVDRIPVMLWLEPHVTLKLVSEVQKPRRAWERGIFDGLRWLSRVLPTEDMRNGVPLLGSLFQNDFQLELGADIVDLHWIPPAMMVNGLRFEGDRLVISDIYQIERSVGGLYMEATGYPCQTPEALDSYRFPDLSNPLFYSHIAAFRAMHPDAAIAVTCPGVQDWSQQWMGMENLYVWLVDHPGVMHRFFNRMVDHTLTIIPNAMRAGADLVIILDDYGAQNSMMMSKAMWKRFTFPCLKAQCEAIHRAGGIAMLHSCGVVAPLLDLFVEAGVDIVHPFQPLPGNNLADAKAKFGDRISFATGIDVQKLPTVSASEVRESMLESVRVGAAGGGLVLAATNGIQHDTPTENLKMMLNTIKEIWEKHENI